MNRFRVVAIALLFACAAGFLSSGFASDRLRWLCESKEHVWVQPTHGRPYCGDGSGNPWIGP